MPASFLGLPVEIRNEIYKYLLVSSEPIDLQFGEEQLTPSILFTNTTILHEARVLLYGHNCFNFTRYLGDISKFFDTIGLINASHVRCILIRLPDLIQTKDGVSLDQHDLSTLEKTLSQCTNLKTIIADLSSTLDMEKELELFDPAIRDNALALLAAQFRAIPSHPEIVLEVLENSPGSGFRRKMQSHGWKLKVVKPEEDGWCRQLWW